MVLDTEPLGASGPRGGCCDGLLEVVGGRYVFDQTAARAHDVMVVPGQLLRELVAGVVVVCDDAPHDAGLFQHDEVAVRGALREAATQLEYLRDGERPVGAGEHLHQPRPVRGQARPVRAELPCDRLREAVVVGGGHRGAVYRGATSLGSGARRRYPGRMEPDHIDEEEARRRLTGERERVTGLIASLREELGDTSERDEIGELAGYDQHPADMASETFEREKDLAILEGLESELAELEAALGRIDDGTWGVDEVTGEPIDPARLEAYPAARTNIGPPERRR